MSDTLAIGRIGYYRFTNGSLLDESGNNKNLTSVGTPTYSNNEVVFNKTSYMYVDTELLDNDMFGFSFWFNNNDTAIGSIFALTDISGESYPLPVIFFYKTGANTIKLYVNNQYTNNIAILSDYNHICGSTNGIYLNGVKIYGNISLYTRKKSRMYLNNGYTGISAGKMDEISLYNRALTDLECSKLYEKGITSGADTTPPVFNSVNIDTITYNSANLNVNSSEDGKVYYQLLLRNSTAPTSIEIKENPENIINVTKNITSIFPITLLDANTDFDLYAVAEDNVLNLQLEPTKIQFTTLIYEKLIIDSYISEIQQNYGKFKVSSNKNATIYYMLSIKGTYNSPSPTDIVADQTGNQYCIKDIQYEISFITSENTSYDLFIVAKDDLDNYSDVIKHTFRTPFDNSSYKKIFKKIHNFKISDKIHLISTKEMYYQILSESEFALQNYDINNSSINKYISPIKISDIGNKILYIVEYDNDNYTISDIQRIYPLQIENKINSSYTFNKQ